MAINSLAVSRHTVRKHRVRRTSRLVRRAMLAVLPILLLLSAFLMFRHQAAADTNMTDTYIVQPGDSLWRIALTNAPESMDVRVYVQQLKQLNNLKQSVILVGQTLRLPSK